MARLMPVASGSVGSMYMLLFCCLLYHTVVPLSASELDIYPELSDAVIYNRIQHMLTQLRREQLRVLQSEDQEVLPQFTYNFPEEPNRQYQSDLFAVPPSDPRYYQPEIDLKVEKKLSQDDVQSLTADEDGNSQLGSPVTETDETVSYEVTSEVNEPEEEESQGVQYVFKKILKQDNQDIILVAVIAGCSAAAVAGLTVLLYGWYRLHNKSKAAADVEYPAYGVTGPNKEISPTGDRRLAQSAQMYHYQHQKQQIIAMESNRANNERRGSVSEGDSDEENEEGDYTVYECPGLAAQTGELEVKNPLFQDDPTPATGNHVNQVPSSTSDTK